MKDVLSSTCTLVVVTSSALAFSPAQQHLTHTNGHLQQSNGRSIFGSKAFHVKQSKQVLFMSTNNNDGQFDFDSVLGEGLRSGSQSLAVTTNSRRTANVITLPDSSAASNAERVTMTSAVAADGAVSLGDTEVGTASTDEAVSGSNELSFDSVLPGQTGIQKKNIDLGKQSLEEYTTKYSKYPSISKLWGENDYLGIIWAYMIPLCVGTMMAGVLGSYGQKAYLAKQEDTLASYANEMVYHDGDFEEMKMCHSDYRRKMKLFVGPKKLVMLKRFLEVYAKKKPVSPQAVSSLSYVFSIYKLSEQKAANILVEVAKLLEGKPASAGKLLFFGKRILKSPEAKEALEPIRKMLAASYKVGGDMFVENAQKTMGESAYRSAVAAAGDGQESLTAGWEVLGLTQETAQTIFDEVKEDGFMTGAQKLYGGGMQSKFDAKGRKLKDNGELVEPLQDSDDDDDNESPAGTVFECGECGYTMFPAKGREFKFIGADFKCPECGAAKDKFVDRSKQS